jgi:[ribosomal protein S18]-alanine N-acetyltransferase
MIVAGAAHAHVMAAIHADCFPPAERWSAGSIAEQLELRGTFALVAQAGGFVLARVAADEAEILTLGVARAARRQGFGTALVKAAAARAAGLGARTMFLEVSSQNTPARALYAACGFVRAGRRRAYYRDRSDALVLRLELGAPAP